MQRRHGTFRKRRLDRNVAHGHDILDVESAFDVLNESCTKVTTYLVSEKDIDKIEELTKDVNLYRTPNFQNSSGEDNGNTGHKYYL